MTVKNFFFGLIASFAIPWLVVIAIPYTKMRSLDPVQYDEINDGQIGDYNSKSLGNTGAGYAIYAQEGCATCHSQVSRPTYAGNDIYQSSLAGIASDPERGDTRRETNVWDYMGQMDDQGKKYAWIGETRIGPDLGNYGRRVEVLAAKKNEELAAALGVEVDDLTLAQRFNSESYVMAHLFNPRLEKDLFWSTCPSNPHLFKTIQRFGQGTMNALPVQNKDESNDDLVIPKDGAIQLTSYLLGLKRDNEVPYSINYRRDKVKASEKK